MLAFQSTVRFGVSVLPSGGLLARSVRLSPFKFHYKGVAFPPICRHRYGEEYNRYTMLCIIHWKTAGKNKRVAHKTLPARARLSPNARKLTVTGDLTAFARATQDHAGIIPTPPSLGAERVNRGRGRLSAPVLPEQLSWPQVRRNIGFNEVKKHTRLISATGALV